MNASSPCEIQSGFFIRRDCGRPAVGECSECGRGFCKKHEVKMAQGGSLCTACAEKRGLLEDENDFGQRRYRDEERQSPWRIRSGRQREQDRDRNRDADDDQAAAAAATTGAAFTAAEMNQFEEGDQGAAGTESESEAGFDNDGFADASEDISIFDS